MDVIIMPSIRSLVRHLAKDYPQYSFEIADEFWWSAKKKTVYYNPDVANSSAFTLHELSHAILGHSGYSYDINLIKLERDAWQYADQTLSKGYAVDISNELIQDNMDTYRTWLHSRSLCPECDATGLQAKDYSYSCLSCGHRWRSNEARVKALRRYAA